MIRLVAGILIGMSVAALAGEKLKVLHVAVEAAANVAFDPDGKARPLKVDREGNVLALCIDK